jgi:hypothetical protein
MSREVTSRNPSVALAKEDKKCHGAYKCVKISVMKIKIVTDSIRKTDIAEIAKQQFGDLVKTVVDVEKGVMAIGGELHADEEAILIEHGSDQRNLWGINLYPAKSGEDFIEFDSMINIRPSRNNNSRSVDDVAIQEEIRTIVFRLVKK